MVKVRLMNEDVFAKNMKEFNVSGETIKARQEEKQGLLDDFDTECKRFFFGKISEKSLQSSVNKTNAELSRLDKEIRQNMAKAHAAAARNSKLVSAQAPVGFRATMSGIRGGGAGGKKKRHHHKKKRR